MNGSNEFPDELTPEQLERNNRAAEPKGTPKRSKSKEIFAAKKKEPVPVPVKKSRPTPEAPTAKPKGAPASAAEAKEHPATAPTTSSAPKYKLGTERKAELNAKQNERQPVPKVGARGVKARPRPVPKKKGS